MKKLESNRRLLDPIICLFYSKFIPNPAALFFVSIKYYDFLNIEVISDKINNYLQPILKSKYKKDEVLCELFKRFTNFRSHGEWQTERTGGFDEIRLFSEPRILKIRPSEESSIFLKSRKISRSNSNWIFFIVIFNY